jgi:hypothetical protein
MKQVKKDKRLVVPAVLVVVAAAVGSGATSASCGSAVVLDKDGGHGGAGGAGGASSVQTIGVA